MRAVIARGLAAYVLAMLEKALVEAVKLSRYDEGEVDTEGARCGAGARYADVYPFDFLP
jgi:hypothetical protein